MGKLSNLNNEEIKFLKEANVVIDINKEYTVDERKHMLNQVMGYIMNFSKKDIPNIQYKYEPIIEILRK